MNFIRPEPGVERRAPVADRHSGFDPRLSAFGSRPSRRAFTLIEILVAMAIFAIIIMAIYSTWTLIMRASVVGQDAAARAQRERVALRTIEDSLTCIQSFQASMKYYSFVVQNGDQPFLSYTAQLPDTFPRNGKFDGFTLRRLFFTVEPGPGSEKNLVLRQAPVLMDMDRDEQQTPLVLARNVQLFTIECLDPKSGDWVTEWNDTNSIPTEVRINLALAAEANTGRSAPAVTRLIAIPSVTLPSVLQVGH